MKDKDNIECLKFTELNKENKLPNQAKGMKLLNFITSVFLALFILSFSVILTLRMNWTYKYTKPDKQTASYYGFNLKDATINENYNNLIDYMFSPMNEKLTFKELPMSNEGEIHFYEVKVIFRKFIYLMVISLFTVLAIGSYLLKNKNYIFLKKAAKLVILIPVILAIPIAIDFNWTFITFHKIAFSNDYWIFDPIKDAIILYLPESLFMINAIIILIMIVIQTLLITLLYKKLK